MTDNERHLFGEVEPPPPIESVPPPTTGKEQALSGLASGTETAPAGHGGQSESAAAVEQRPPPRAPAAALPYMSASDYHAIKALSAGMIWAMDSECPLKAWLASPWNPNCEPVNATHFDIGTALHLAVLEPHLIDERIVAHGHDDYRSKDAKAARDSAYAAGKTPLKPAEWAIVEGMQREIANSAAKRWLTSGVAEASLMWEWDGMLCKCRPDYLADDYSYILDLKTANTCNPRAIARKAFNEGWFVRAAWYMAGVKEASGVLPDKYIFVVVEKDAPHIIELFEIDVGALMLGDKIIERTLQRVAACFRANHWPGYGDGSITTLRLPSWQMAERVEEFNE